MRILLFILLAYSIQSNAAWDGCKRQVRELTIQQKDIKILKKAEPLLEKLGFANCSGDLVQNVTVAIHEGVHFIDLDLMSYNELPKDISEFDRTRINFLLTNQQRIPIPKIQLPKPYPLLKAAMASKDVKNVVLDFYSFMDFYDSYVEDRDALTSWDFVAGLTELNAYEHSLKSSWQFYKDGKGTLDLSNTSRFGYLFFLSLTKMYLYQLQKSDEVTFDRLVSDAPLKSLLRKFTILGINTLKSTDHCTVRKQDPIIDRMSDIALFMPGNKIMANLASTKLWVALQKKIYCK